MKPKILVVEDEKSIAKVVTYNLERARPSRIASPVTKTSSA